MKQTSPIPHIISGILQMCVSGILFTWSYFRAPLQGIYPDWTVSMLSAIFMTHNIVVGIMMLVSGTFVKKIHPKIPLGIGGFLVGLGIFLMSLLPANSHNAYIMAIICYGVISPIGVAFTGITTLNTYPKWAPNHVGLVSGLLLLGFGTVSFIYGAISSALIPEVGILMTFRYLGIICWVVAAIAFPMTRLPRPEDNLPPQPVRAENLTGKQFTTSEAIRTANFWALFLFNLFMRGTGLMFADHAATIATAFGAAALFGMLYSPANGCASVVSGFFVDKLGFTFTMRLFVFIQLAGCASLFIGALSHQMIFILIGLIFGGFSYGGTTAVASSGTRMLFGEKHFSSTYGVIGLAVLLAAFLGNMGGIVVEKMNGSYYGIFTLCTIYACLSLCTALFLAFQVRKMAKEVTEGSGSAEEAK